MQGSLVSTIEWRKKDGKWTCSLVCYDGGFSRIWLESGINLSFKIQPGRYCVGYTIVSSHMPKTAIALEPWKDDLTKGYFLCPSKAKLKKGCKCSSCYQVELSCLICDGTKCSAEPSLQRHCQKATAYVYISSFGLRRVKVGAAHHIPRRWIEQGANLAKRIIVGNGMEVRRFEKAIHNSLNVLSGLKATDKIDTLWKRQNIEAEVRALFEAEQEIKKQFTGFPYYHDSIYNLSDFYNLPPLDRRPLELEIRKNMGISGRILGAKGSLLLLSIGDLPYFLNLNRLVGRKIELKKAKSMIMQTALDKF